MRVGVLASQGAFVEHIAVLRRLKIDAQPVRLPQELPGLDGLISPGGESTSISKLMLDYNLAAKIKSLAKDGLAIFGTCAGMILLAKGLSDPKVKSLELMDIKVNRNAFGRQVDSFEADLSMPALGDKPFPGVFIRAPLIERAGNGVEVLARLSDGTMVAAREGKFLACAFHPELTDDLRLHQYFIDMAAGKK